MDKANRLTVIDIVMDRHCGGCEYSTTINGMEGPGDEYCGECANIDKLYEDLEKTEKKDFWDFLGFDNYCIYCKHAIYHKKPFSYWKCEKNGKIFNTDLEKPTSSVYCPGFENGAFIDLFEENKKIVEREEKNEIKDHDPDKQAFSHPIGF